MAILAEWVAASIAGRHAFASLLSFLASAKYAAGCADSHRGLVIATLTMAWWVVLTAEDRVEIGRSVARLL